MSEIPNPYKPKKKTLSLTQRGQKVVAGAVVAAGVAGFAGGRLTAPEGSDSGHQVPEATVSYVAQPGDTIWGIARTMHGEGEIRPLVDQLENQIGNDGLQIGEAVHVPRSQVHNPEYLEPQK